MYTVQIAFVQLSQVTHAQYATKPDVDELLALSKSLAGRQGPFFSKYQLMPLTSTAYNEYGQLGVGAFSAVFRCINRDAGDEYAVKIIGLHPTDPNKPNERVNDMNNSLQREISMLKRCQGHPNIVKLEEVIIDSEYIYIVMELLRGGSLGHRIWERGFPLSLDSAQAVFKQLVSAIEYMHSKGVAHRDLKPDNVIFVNATSDLVKIADFGFACPLVGDKIMFQPRCTFNYAAPEVLYQFIVRNEPSLLKAENAQLYRTDACDSSSDLWSLGATLFQMLNGKAPFYTIKEERSDSLAFHANTILEKIIEERGKKGEFTKSVGSSAEATELVVGLLTLHSANRMTLEQLKVHPWMVADDEEEVGGTPAKRIRRT